MSQQQTTIRKLAELVKTPVQTLLVQMAQAGMKFTDAEQKVSSEEKKKLLDFLRRAHGRQAGTQETAPAVTAKKITLSRRKHQEVTAGTGRSKSKVNVEVRAKRTFVKPDVAAVRASTLAAGRQNRDEILRKLEESRKRSEEEQRQLAEKDRLREEAIAQKKAAERAAEEAALQAQREAEQAAQAAKEAAEAAAEAAKQPKPAAVEKPAATSKARQHTTDAASSSRASGEREERSAAPAKAKSSKSRSRNSNNADKEDGNRFGGQLHLSTTDRAKRGRGSRSGGRGQSGSQRGAETNRRGATGSHGFERPTAPVVREVAIGDTITVADLAQKLALKGGEVVKALFKMGVMVTVTQTIDYDTAALVSEELGHKVTHASSNDMEDALLASANLDPGLATSRPPVVTIMGHVDHGKTSLLDYIRRTKVAPGEAGGITQHIGAYHVTTPKGVVSFLDTPGHEAFTAMRARGAQLTDIVVVVVAADDGVMPQTIEAIKHARTANAPVVVAINKIDKSSADPARVKNELLAQQIVAEEFGGDVQMAEISAKTGQGIDELLDAIVLQAEVLELKAVAEGPASGLVIESALDKGRGSVATVLVRQGQLHKGDYLVCGTHYGRVRALFDETGKQVASAGPSIPVQILGLSGVPDAGDDFVAVADERLARSVAQQRETRRRESRLVTSATGKRMEDIMAQMSQGQAQQVLNLVVKADVQGSVQALVQSLTALSNEQIRINVIASGVGGITESDAHSATTAKATLIGFNVRADASARKVIDTNGLDLRYFSIIYDVIDQVKQVASGLLGVEIREEIIGIAEVRDVFRSSKFGAVAGCMVVEGTVRKSKPIRVLRNSVVVFEGELESLRRFKENVEEIRNGTECGIGVKAYNDIQPGDQIECFERTEVQRTL